MNWKKALTLSLFFAIGVFLFWKTITIIPEDERPRIWEDMVSAPKWAIMMSFIMGLLAIVSRGLRWLLLLEPMGYSPSRFRSVCAVAFGYLSNTFVPRSGEIVRCATLKSTDDIPVNKLIGTVITERVVDFIMLFLFMSSARNNEPEHSCKSSTSRSRSTLRMFTRSFKRTLAQPLISR